MQLIARKNVGADLHRSGWPVVMSEIEKLADGNGVLLDDCCIQTFRFTKNPQPHRVPWVGIFHSPVDTSSSPCLCDHNDNAYATSVTKAFIDSLSMLRGFICMASTLTHFWSCRAFVPGITLLHPTETKVPQWSFDAFSKNPTMLQLGQHLRDLRAIFRVPEQLWWKYKRIATNSPHHAMRDATIRDSIGYSEVNKSVETIQRVDNAKYDEMMASSVVLTRPYGVAACNVIVECIARGTPIIVDRTPETEEYLGKDYCLFANEYDDLDLIRILEASVQLLDRKGPWIEPSNFAGAVSLFCEVCEIHENIACVG